MRNLIYRIITSLILLPGVIGAFILGGYYLFVVLFFAGILAVFEVAEIIHKGSTYAKLMALLFWIGLFLPAGILKSYITGLGFMVPMILIFNLTILFVKAIEKINYEKFCAIFYWSFYISLSLSSLYWLRVGNENLDPQVGLSFVFLAIVSTWGNDTFAYFGGRIFGKNPLLKRISQKKTWEGFILGGLGAILLVFFAKYGPLYFGMDWLYGLSVSDLWWISLPAVGLAPLGDLFASRLKRFYDCKDSSKILPGHGGVLDRIDGILMVVPWTALFAFLIRPLY